jgi:SulP family sulfate permease
MGVSSEKLKKITLAKPRPLARDRLLALFPFLSWVRFVTCRSLRADLIAGLTGAVIVLPQGVVFALIAGLPPEYGLYTAIIIPIVAGLFGSSRHMISGPTTAISVVVMSVVSPHVPLNHPQYIPYVLTLTFLTGLIQFLMGLARMGSLVNFISHTVIVGFTTGAAILIVISQLELFLGFSVKEGGSVFHSIHYFIRELGNSNPYVVAVAIVTLLVALLIRRYRPRWPSMLIGMIAGSLVCLLIDGQNHGVPLVGSLPGRLPPLSKPEFSMTLLSQLIPGALALAMLGLIEAVSIARALAARSQQRIDGNQEFIGQGLANMVGSFFSCYAGSGSFTRSGINYEAGAKTPLSAILASLLVGLMLVFLAPLTAFLPLPAVAGVIVLVAWNLIDIHRIRQIILTSKSETLVLLITCLSTFVVALEFAIYVGVLLSLVLYLQRTSHPKIISVAPDPSKPKRLLNNAAKYKLLECPQLKILRLDGSLFFGAVDHVQKTLRRLAAKRDAEWKHVLIIASGINFIDVTGAEMLTQEAQRLRSRGGALYLCGLKATARETLRRGGYINVIGQENLFSSKEEAIRLIFQRLDKGRCALCQRRIFRECAAVEFTGAGYNK